MPGLNDLWRGLRDMLTTTLDTYRFLRDTPGLVIGHKAPLSPLAHYEMLWAYYDSNDLYDAVTAAMALQSRWMEAMRPLRNPTFRGVEFHVAHLWPGSLPEALPIETANARIVEPIQQVWEWSNWGAKKQLAARWLAAFGDLFVKVVTATDDEDDVKRVYFQLIDPRQVVDFEVDERGFITWIRLDVPRVKREGEKDETYWHTEVWDKASGRYRAWEHDRGYGADLEKIGRPRETRSLLDDFGIDFVPFVHAPFIDEGNKRGVALIDKQRLKIDEVNRQVTRLHQMQFRYNKPTWALEANMMDASGRPLPPPRLQGAEPGEEGSSGDTVAIGDDRLYRLPGMSKLSSLVPDIDYMAALAIIDKQLEELERDLPELTCQRLREQGELSGRAIRLMLGDAIARVEEARGNAQTALARADAMALTLAQQAGLEGFSVEDIGTYQAGEFEHTFAKRDVIVVSVEERLESLSLAANAGLPVVTAMRLLRFSAEEIADVEADLAAQRAQAERDRAQAALQALRDLQAQGQEASTSPDDSGTPPEEAAA